MDHRMFQSQEEQAAGKGAVLILIVLAGIIWRLVAGVRNAPVTADPWGPEIDANVHQPDAVPICHRCLTAQERRHDHWFCAECGASVGEYNNYLPYIHIFAEGEVWRYGTSGIKHPNFLMFTGYFLYSLTSYWIVAPVYWFFLLKNLKRTATKPRSNDPDIPAAQ